jgi:hypothetical protein
MPVLSHVILHLALCGPVAKLPPEAVVAIHVRAVDRRDQVQVDRTFRMERGDDEQRIVEFDIPWGIYRVDSSVAKYGCSAKNYFSFLPEHDRSIAQTLVTGPAPDTTPMLLDGAAPESFLYVKPTFVLFDKGAAACGKPIPDPLPSHIDVDNGSDAFYATLYPDAPLPAGAVPMLALRLKTPTHQYHYVRLPIPVQLAWGGWPSSIQFTVTEDMVDQLASEPVDTLLCPKLWETSSH